MTPISKEAILSLPYDYWIGLDGKPEAICIFMEDFNKLPDKVDAVEVIRCKYCKYHHYDNGIPYCSNIDYGYGWKDEDFCSKAERR